MVGMVPAYPKTQEKRSSTVSQRRTDMNYMWWYHARLQAILSDLIETESNPDGYEFDI